MKNYILKNQILNLTFKQQLNFVNQFRSMMPFYKFLTLPWRYFSYKVVSFPVTYFAGSYFFFFFVSSALFTITKKEKKRKSKNFIMLTLLYLIKAFVHNQRGKFKLITFFFYNQLLLLSPNRYFLFQSLKEELVFLKQKLTPCSNCICSFIIDKLPALFSSLKKPSCVLFKIATIR